MNTVWNYLIKLVFSEEIVAAWSKTIKSACLLQLYGKLLQSTGPL